jgi:hypothetical protein
MPDGRGQGLRLPAAAHEPRARQVQLPQLDDVSPALAIQSPGAPRGARA